MGDKDAIGSRKILIRQILTYLLKYPEAKDTVEGIKRWWLTEYQDNHRAEDVRKAIQWLVEQGWLRYRESRTSEIIYGLNKAEIKQVREFVDENMSSKSSDVSKNFKE
ncbi:MAG: hypothetical protein NPIRA02_09800 [Nitrospirales bacterium]|nr:MAG: hypothetical protein NPIRA02_09800 [Nitrospirales bacterium]